MRFDEKHKENLSKSLTGRKLTEEQKQKISKANKGRIGYWTGKKRGPQTEEWKRNIGLGCLKHFVSEKTKKRMSMLNQVKFGKEHPCYKEVKKHPFHKLIRETYKYREWRKSIFTRDDYTCVFCGIKGAYLEADHYPKRFIDIINEFKIDTLDKALDCVSLWDINNGRTLCDKCHHKTLSWGR